jgi:two-component system, sensor histidine kinase PdtaS
MSDTPRPSSTGSDLDRAARYQEILVDFSRMVSESDDLQRLLQLTTLQAARGIGIRHTKLMRYRQEHGDLLIVAGVGWNPGIVGHVTVGADVRSPAGCALQSRQPVTVEDLPNDPEFRYPPVLRDHGIVAALNVPVAVDGTVWGVLEVDSEVSRHFGQMDINFLLVMANILGSAIHSRQGLEAATSVGAEAVLVLTQYKTLFRELLHRDKNDFQLIVSILLMQKRKHQDPEAKRGFDHVIDRVSAISLAHDQLSTREGRGSIELADYLGALCGNLGQRREEITVHADLDRAELTHDRAVPLGLMINELVTNALKHAFPDSRPGAVRVTFRADPNGEGHVSVADDGVGMGPSRSGSSGTELVRALARQIGGTVVYDTSEQGTTANILFPLVI